MIDFHPNEMVTEVVISMSLCEDISELLFDSHFHLQVKIPLECDVANVLKDTSPEKLFCLI